MRAVAVLFAVLLAIAGCSQPSQAPEQGEKEDVARAVEETPATTPPSVQGAEGGVAAPASGSSGAEVTSEGSALPTVNASASVDTSRMQNFDCRIQAHALEEGMDAQESEAFADEMGDRLVEDMEAGGDKDVGDILDDMGVPAYEEQCGPPL
jgi:hypothetical protein